MMFFGTSALSSPNALDLLSQKQSQSSKPQSSLSSSSIANASRLGLTNAIITDPLPVEQAFKLSATRDGTTATLNFLVASGYYLYKDKLSVKADASKTLDSVVYPKGLLKYDETFGKTLETYRGTLTLSNINIQAKLSDTFTVNVYSQGCADIGICYPPQLQRITFVPNQTNGTVVSLGNLPDQVPSQASNAGEPLRINKTKNVQSLLNEPLSISEIQTNTIQVPVSTRAADKTLNATDLLINKNLLFVFIGFVFLGLLLSFTPCVLPMVPIVSAIVLGKTNQHESPLTALKGFKLTSAYVAGMAIVYTLIGVAAGLIGQGLSAFLQNPFVLVVFALLMVALAGSQFGFYQLTVPERWINRLNQNSGQSGKRQYLGLVVMGALSAVMVGPCVTAPLAGVLAFIAQTGDAWLGAFALFSLSLGMGIPLLLIGVGGSQVLPKVGVWMNQISHFFGVMLLAVALWLIQSLFPVWLSTGLWVLILLLIAEAMGSFTTNAPVTRLSRLFKALGYLALVWATAILIGMASGRFDVITPLKGDSLFSGASTVTKNIPTFKKIGSSAYADTLNKAKGKLVLIDVYADWCVSCIEFEKFTFSDPAVSQAMSQMTLIKVDVTHNTADDRALMKQLKLFGPPAILFFNQNGDEISDSRVIGFQSSAPFFQHLNQLLTANR
jgi:thiol:disulfide interchange protein DsbD